MPLAASANSQSVKLGSAHIVSFRRPRWTSNLPKSDPITERVKVSKKYFRILHGLTVFQLARYLS